MRHTSIWIYLKNHLSFWTANGSQGHKCGGRHNEGLPEEILVSNQNGIVPWKSGVLFPLLKVTIQCISSDRRTFVFDRKCWCIHQSDKKALSIRKPVLKRNTNVSCTLLSAVQKHKQLPTEQECIYRFKRWRESKKKEISLQMSPPPLKECQFCCHFYLKIH